MKLPKLGSLVQVEWDDAAVTTGWSNGLPTTSRCVSYGIVMGASKRQLSIAGSTADRDSVGRFNQRLAIPVGCIRSIRRLKVGKRVR